MDGTKVTPEERAARFVAAQCVECAKPVFAFEAIRCVGCTADKYRRENPNCCDCGQPLDTPWIRCWSCMEKPDYADEPMRADTWEEA